FYVRGSDERPAIEAIQKNIFPPSEDGLMLRLRGRLAERKIRRARERAKMRASVFSTPSKSSSSSNENDSIQWHDDEMQSRAAKSCVDLYSLF
ncbi:unnamed protein product, partial [Amoebophrya sp. A25]